MTSSARILVADDDPMLCQLLRETLREAGYDVLVAANGDEVVRLAQDQSPDLLLIDLMMPLMDGFEVIRQLRNDTRTAHLPMIILTARSASNEVVSGFDSGADDYITKPYDTDVLLARIRGHLRRAAQRPVRNPLTGLPGNVLLQAELEHHLSQRQRFALLYIDLNNFKAFNDRYGFSRGDRAIHLLANVLNEVASRDDFVGHIGGDDFAIIHAGPDPEDLCRRIIATFDARVASLYDEADLKRGYLQGFDRQGVLRRFGLLSLSIAMVSTYARVFHSVDEMSKVAAELKTKAKLNPSSSYEIDRRQSGYRAQVHRERRGRRRPVALVVVPADELRAALATALRAAGYRFLGAPDVVAAHSILAHTPVLGVIVADIGLGPAVLDLWRDLPAPPPMVALAADAASADAARAAGAGGTVLLAGPPPQIAAAVIAALPAPEEPPA